MSEYASSIDEIIRAGELLGAAGLTPGTTGNISVRIGDRMLVSGTGSRLGALSPEDLSVLGPDGELLSGPSPTKEYVLHLESYRRRPDTDAIVHLHSPAALAASCLAGLPVEHPLPVYTPYYAMRAGRVRLIEYFPPGGSGLAAAVAHAAEEADSMLLRRHGLVCLAGGLEAAVAAAEELEMNADIHLRLNGRAATPLNDDEISALQHWRKATK